MQGKCIACLPRPHEVGTPPWCCPKPAGFWRPGCASWRSAYGKLVRSPGLAPGHAPWQRAILLLNHNRRKRVGRSAQYRARLAEEIKRAGTSLRSGPCHFNKEQTPLAISLRYQPADSRRLFRCLGAHLLRSPQIVKAGQIVPARSSATCGQTPSVRSFSSSAPFLILCGQTSSRRRFNILHSQFTFRCCQSPSVSGQ